MREITLTQASWFKTKDGKTHNPGDKLSVDDATAQSLVQAGSAVFSTKESGFHKKDKESEHTTVRERTDRDDAHKDYQ